MNIMMQKCMPQRFLSRLMGALSNWNCLVLKNWAIRRFIDTYDVNMAESEIPDYREFPTFNAFFTRALKPGARNLTVPKEALICPVDGGISEFGAIEDGRLLQAKGQYFTSSALLGSSNEAQMYNKGSFITLYLAPKDYHRVHMPFAGKLRSIRYIPGKLFSVNPAAVNGIPGLFAKNERVVCSFDSEFGPMAVIFVGAMIVASIFLKCCGQVAPQRSRAIIETDMTARGLSYQRGDELGHFQLGSTVIVMLPKGVCKFNPKLVAGQSVQLGDKLGECLIGEAV